MRNASGMINRARCWYVTKVKLRLQYTILLKRDAYDTVV